jgi:hypothetical protein
MNRIVGLALALAGCANAIPPSDAEPITEAGPSVDALVGGGMPGGGGPRPDASAMGPRPDAGRPMGACANGQPPALCAECGPDGLPRLIADDDRCPPLDCSVLDTYVRTMDQGATICVRQHHAPSTGHCLAIGQCRQQADADYCGMRQADAVGQGDHPCAMLQGCDGQTPPSFAPVAPGTPCPGGACDMNGACLPVVDDPRCDQFQDRTRCGAGIHVDGSPYCDVALAEAMNCADLCGTVGATCLGAVSAGATPCERGAEHGCLEATPPLICRCSAPRQ